MDGLTKVFDSYYPLACLVAFLASIVSVGLHYEILEALNRIVSRFIGRLRVLITLLCLMVLHMFEIAIFALVYWLLALEPKFGEIAAIESSYDYIYYSSIVYTTVGFGDLYPIGPVRIVTAIESLIGLVLITWSATFIFIHRPIESED